MITSSTPKSFSLPNISALKNLLDVLAALREVSNPFASLDDLTKALQLLLNVCGTIGISPQLIQWLQYVHDNPQLLEIVLAVGQYLESL